MGRWLIMAGLCSFPATTGLGSFVGLASTLDGQAASAIHVVGLYMGVGSFLGIPGCLLAAAIHPKDLTKP